MPVIAMTPARGRIVEELTSPHLVLVVEGVSLETPLKMNLVNRMIYGNREIRMRIRINTLTYAYTYTCGSTRTLDVDRKL